MKELLLASTAAGLGLDKIWAMIEPASPFGREEKGRARAYLPGEEAALEEELGRVEAARRAGDDSPPVMRALVGRLGRLRDLRGSVAAAVRGAALEVVELYELKRFALISREIEELLGRLSWPLPPDLRLEAVDGVLRALDPQGTGSPGFHVGDQFSTSLARLRRRKRAAERSLEEGRREQAFAVAGRLGVKPGPGGEVVLPAGDRRVLLAREESDLLPVREAGGFLYFRLRPGARAREAEAILAHLKEQERREEARVRGKLSRAVARWAPALSHNMAALGRLDFLLARARLARETAAVRPVILPPGSGVVLREARHPGVEQDLGRSGRRFTPVSLELRPGAAVLTGPNMGGKTVALRTLGLAVAMAQLGLPVPAGHMAWSPVAFIFYGGQEEENRPGLSAFAAEVTRVREPLGRLDEAGLLLLDEFARGTNPREGRALCAAILGRLARGPSVCLLATHHSGLAELVGTAHWQTRGLRGDVLAGEDGAEGVDWLYEHMDYRLERVAPGKEAPRDALVVARLLGLDEGVVELAERYLGETAGEGERP
ncbi:MAG: hypothetical protein RDU89_02370 [bacterium]|nr:hypothetical protein [bacterium]